MEDLNVVNDTQEQTVDAQIDADVDSGVESTESEPAQETQTEVTPQKQSAEDNSKFASLRREAEAKAKEATQFKAENDRLLKALSLHGYADKTPIEIADMLEAAATNTDIQTVKANREKSEAEQSKLSALEQENQFYKSLALEKLKADDFAKIKEVYPDIKAKTLDELGKPVLDLIIEKGIDAVTAYDLVQLQEQRNTKKAPPEIGAVNQSSSKEKDFYSPSDVDKLTPADFKKDKTLLEKVQKSMAKWK